MTFAFTQDVPIDAAFYARIQEQLGTSPPEGLVAHLALERPEGGLRYLDVWESEEHWQRFLDERVHPVVHPMLESLLGQVPPEPVQSPVALVHVWTQAQSV